MMLGIKETTGQSIYGSRLQTVNIYSSLTCLVCNMEHTELIVVKNDGGKKRKYRTINIWKQITNCKYLFISHLPTDTMDHIVCRKVSDRRIVAATIDMTRHGVLKQSRFKVASHLFQGFLQQSFSFSQIFEKQLLSVFKKVSMPSLLMTFDTWLLSPSIFSITPLSTRYSTSLEESTRLSRNQTY